LEVTQKDQEIQSLTHRNDLHEKSLEEHEAKLATYKGLENDESGARGERDSLQRKIALLEEEAEQNDKNLKETTEKYEAPPQTPITSFCCVLCIGG
jgi:tropomyosin, fungi type